MVDGEHTIHALHKLMVDLGICRVDSLVPFHPRVRDRTDVAALRCNDSGVILLSRVDHIEQSYYEEKEHPELRTLGDRQSVVRAHSEDTERRACQFERLIANRGWVDIGAGSGAMLDRLAGVARTTAAVEPQGEFAAELRSRGYAVVARIDDLEQGFEVATMFHVLEHLTDPLQELRGLVERMEPRGRLVVEVPHARDFLLDFLQLETFRDFTLWSEHLVLHTRESLRRLLERAGLRDITVRGFQRYPLANHLYWLSHGRPGGHERWSMLRGETLDDVYGGLLASLDATDTLIAEAFVPERR